MAYQLSKESQLLRAARRGDVAAVRQLLAEGTNPEGPGEDDKNDWDFRLKHGFGSPLEMAAEAGHLEVVQLLLQVGAERRGDERETFYALYNGHTEVVRCLLEAGVDPDSSTKHGDSLLDAAAAKGHLPFVRLLLEYGGDVDSCWGGSEIGDIETPLEIVARCGHSEVIEVLLEAGAHLRGKSADYFRQMAKEAVEKAARLKLQNALCSAAYDADKSAVERLLQLNADPRMPNEYGNTALHAAILGIGYQRFEKRSRRSAIVRLLAPISDLKQKTTDGKTAFDLAVEWNYVEAIQVLLPLETALSAEARRWWEQELPRMVIKTHFEIEQDRRETEAIMKELEWMQKNPELVEKILNDALEERRRIDSQKASRKKNE